MSRRRAWWIATAAVVVVVAVAGLAVWWTVRATVTSADVDGYRRGPGERQVTVVYLRGPDDRLHSAEVMEQTSTEVVVDVTIRRSRGSSDDIALRDSVVLDLAAPLGDRTVRLRSGVALSPLG
ncbi:MAG: hypothetical protein U0Q15_04320 [Kineosporiaceae bacterium]